MATQTGIDISATVSILGQYMQTADERAFKAAVRCLLYLKGRKTRGLVCRRRSKPSSIVYSDASYAPHGKTGMGWRRSRSGACVTYNGTPASWFSKSQSCVACKCYRLHTKYSNCALVSTCESEYIALSQGAREGRWVQRILRFMGHPEGPLNLMCDNTAAKAVCDLEVDTKRSRHIDVR